jgi:hypothetical protein
MNANNKEKNKDMSSGGESTREGVAISTTGDITNAGDTVRNITDTADIARASISKGIGSQRNVSAEDIAKGTAQSEGVIQGVAQTTEQRRVTGETDRQVSNTEDVPTTVNSGTSSTESAAIDTADIHSDDGARHIEKAQEKPTERVVDKETRSWKNRRKG